MRQDFLIITQPRSGDEILISKLRSHPLVYITLGNPVVELKQKKFNVNTLDEVLQYKFDKQNKELKREEQEITHRLNTRDFMESVYEELSSLMQLSKEEKDVIKLNLDLMYSKNREERHIGYDKMTEYVCQRYKVYGTTFYMNDILSDYKNEFEKIIEKNNNIKVIFLTRENLLWRYVSSLFEVKTNDQGYTKILTNELQIDSNKFIEDVERIIDERNSIIDMLKQYSINPIFITYEDLCKKQRSTLDKIQEYLNVPIQKDDLFGINTENIFEETRPLDTIITNYINVKESLKNTDYFLYFKKAEQDINPLYYKIRDTSTPEYLDFIKAIYRKELIPEQLFKN